MLFFFFFFYLGLPLPLFVLMMMSSRRSCDSYDYKTRDEYQIWVPQMEFMLLLNNNDCKERKVYHVNGDDGCNYWVV